MFDRIDPKLLPYLDSGARQSLQSGALSVDDHQALLDEAKRKHDFVEPSIPKPTHDNLLPLIHGEYADRMGQLPAETAEGIWKDAERQWYEGHRAEAIRKGNETGWRTLPPVSEKEKPAEPRPPDPELAEKPKSKDKKQLSPEITKQLDIAASMSMLQMRTTRKQSKSKATESAEERALRKREELVAREEALQRQREMDGASLWPGVDEQHARRMQAAFENKSEQTLPRSHRISRVLAGGLFALFFGALIQALTLFGVITMNSGHIFMVIAFVAGVLMITTEILPLKPTRHKVAAIVTLGVVLGLIDLVAALYAHKRDISPVPQTSTRPLATVKFVDQGFGDTKFPLRAGQLLGVNFVYKQESESAAHNAHFYYAIGFVRRDVSLEHQSTEIDELFGQIYQAADLNSKSGRKGIDIFPGESGQRFISAILPSLTSDDVQGFKQKKNALAAMARIEYDDTQWAERCVMFISESLPELTNGNIVWQFCPLHNTASIR